MSTQILPFEFDSHEVRALTIDNEPWFVAKDVATALGYGNPHDAVNRHCKGVVKREALTTSGGTQEVRVIAEPDVMRLIVSSKLPSAVEFERKLFEEILPAIRKHGGYLTPAKVEEALLNPDTLIQLATSLKEERAKRAELEAAAEVAKPKVLFADAVATSRGTILIGELAKILRGNGIQIGQNRLFEWMRNNGYLIRRNGTDRNMPTQRSMELGLFVIKETAITHSDGHVTINKTPKVTGKGQQYFVNVFLDDADGVVIDEVA